MIIQHNIMAMNTYRQLGGNNSALSKNLEKLSSGYKINRAGDDAAGLAISEKMRAQITGLDQAQDNVKDAISLVQTAEGAMQEIHDMLNRMVELATQAANGTYTDNDRTNIKEEITALLSEISRIGDNANFNQTMLLNGSFDSQFQIGDSSAEILTLALTVSMNTSGLSLGSVASQIGASGTGAASSANQAITTIKTAIETVSTQRAKLGAVQNRLEHTQNNLGVMHENIQNAESTIRDTDIAEEMMAYTKNNILIQSAQAMLAQANQVPQGVLQLMQ